MSTVTPICVKLELPRALILDEARPIAANIAKLPDPSEDLCSVGNIGQKRLLTRMPEPGKP